MPAPARKSARSSKPTQKAKSAKSAPRKPIRKATIVETEIIDEPIEVPETAIVKPTIQLHIYIKEGNAIVFNDYVDLDDFADWSYIQWNEGLEEKEARLIKEGYRPVKKAAYMELLFASNDKIRVTILKDSDWERIGSIIEKRVHTGKPVKASFYTEYIQEKEKAPVATPRPPAERFAVPATPQVAEAIPSANDDRGAEPQPKIRVRRFTSNSCTIQGILLIGLGRKPRPILSWRTYMPVGGLDYTASFTYSGPAVPRSAEIRENTASLRIFTPISTIGSTRLISTPGPRL